MINYLTDWWLQETRGEEGKKEEEKKERRKKGRGKEEVKRQTYTDKDKKNNSQPVSYTSKFVL